jgi:major vault protein
MADDRRDGGDMVLAPNEYMYVSDQTKGHVDVFVGPTKQSLSNTDQPVIFDNRSKRFVNIDREHAKQLAHTAPEGWYIILKNPAKDNKQPSSGQGKLGSVSLDVGKKVIVPGPVTFCLWPGQMAKILKGHHLRSNQYLLVRVYDEDEARKNWKKAVIKTVSKDDPVQEGVPGIPNTPISNAPAQAAPTIEAEPPKLTMGQILVIKGTDVSFYIPPTGIEVVPDTDVLDESGHPTLVREAVTLERLEYCLLMDEQGSKRYERGPSVVFPEPTEVFITREQNGETVRKFRAIELNQNSGIYIKVISDYKDAAGEHKVGEELFITGKEQMIYFPREEHAIVKYDKSEIHYAIAIPAGEARYVLDRDTGSVSKVCGPKMFLPDPRKQVIVRRILPFRTCSLLYPDNMVAFSHNAKLAGVDIETYMSHNGAEAVSAAAAAAAAPAAAMNFDYEATSENFYTTSIGSREFSRGLAAKAGTKAAGDQFQRHTKYTEPRSIVLSTKYDGAVAINIYTGYAVLLVKSDGSRRVVQGPQTVLLDYDETPEIMELSTGKPKTTDSLVRTAYLRTKANKISDLIEVETSDHCQFKVKLSYRMDFTGDDAELWFAVENYVKFLCDNMRSRLKNAVRKVGVEEFYSNNTDIIRNAILKEGGPRIFSENGMQVYDVEVLGVHLVNTDIAVLINKSQVAIIQSSIALANQRRTLEAGKEEEKIKQEMAVVRAATNAKILLLESEEAELKKKADMVKIQAQADVQEAQLEKELEAQKSKNSVADESRKGQQAQFDLELQETAKRQELKIEMIKAEIAATVSKAEAISPDLISALQAFGDNALVIKAAEAMGPLAILGGKSVGEVIGTLLNGTKLEPAARALGANSKT